jgi:hypothetical protein
VFFETDLGFIPLSVSVTRPAQNFVRVKDKASVMPGTSSVVHIIDADDGLRESLDFLESDEQDAGHKPFRLGSHGPRR